jgi:hypothetical protein
MQRVAREFISASSTDHFRAKSALVFGQQAQDGGHSAYPLPDFGQKPSFGACAKAVQVFNAALQALAVWGSQVDHGRSCLKKGDRSGILDLRGSRNTQTILNTRPLARPGVFCFEGQLLTAASFCVRIAAKRRIFADGKLASP